MAFLPVLSALALSQGERGGRQIQAGKQGQTEGYGFEETGHGNSLLNIQVGPHHIQGWGPRANIFWRYLDESGGKALDGTQHFGHTDLGGS